MKHMFLRSSFVLVFAATLLTIACSKGDNGPAGEKGDKGDKGDTGAAGAAGKAGSANVIYSTWQDVTYGAIDSLTFGAVIDAPRIVDSIVQKGEVKVYWNINTAGNPTIVSLPYVDANMVFGVPDLFITPLVKVGKIYLYSSYNMSSGTAQGTTDKIWQYRYVVVPGGVAARKATIDWNDYSQVKDYLGLKD